MSNEICNRNLKPINENIIPIFFATDDNYIPFLDVALISLIENASLQYTYHINILHTGVSEQNINLICRHSNKNFNINFVDVTISVDGIKEKLRKIFHFGLAAYYRLFIASLFPQYQKVIYLDCDLVVLGDISQLYNLDMGENIVAGAIEQFVLNTKEFSDYSKTVLGIDSRKYINSGVLVIDLDNFRKNKIEEKFIYLLDKYNFEVIAPDQDYINFLCYDRILYLPSGWNMTPLEFVKCEGGLNIAHYALYKKPWQYDNVLNGEYFWSYAKRSIFYDKILNCRENFKGEVKRKKEAANVEIVNLAVRISNSDHTFYKELIEKIDGFMGKISFA